MTSNNEEKKGLEIVEENAFENNKEENEVIIENELENFYENHKETFDLIGGLDIFETLMSLSDNQFETLHLNFLSVIKATLDEKATEKEFRMLLATEDWTPESIEKDFTTVIQTIEEIDFLSPLKKDFLKEIFLMTINKLQEFINIPDKSINIPCELEDNVQLPTYAHKTDAGLDIYAREEITIGPGETKIISTGIKTAIPEGYAILIQPRSGQSVKTKLRIANTPGLIDSGYRDDIGVIIENIEPPFKDIDYDMDEEGEIHINSIEHGQAYTIAEGQRFAQMRLVQVPKANFVEVESVGDIGEDREGGFGSSGE